MPDPKESNRERLLRLIDGGPDVVKQLSQERQAKTVEHPASAPVSPPAAPSLIPAVDGLPKDWIRWALGLVLVVVLLAGVFFATQIFQSFTRKTPTVAASSSSVPPEMMRELEKELAEAQGDQGTGLRLVGVDSSEPPVALIEDLKTGKTYFARKNDKVKNAKVKQIYKNRIEVFVNGKIVELR